MVSITPLPYVYKYILIMFIPQLSCSLPHCFFPLPSLLFSLFKIFSYFSCFFSLCLSVFLLWWPPPHCVLFGFLILSWISWMKITYRSVVPASGYTAEENVLFFSQRPLKTACSYSGKDEISWGNQYLPLKAWGWIASSCVGPLSANRNVLRPRMPKHCLVLKTAFRLAPFHLPALTFLSSSSSLMFPERSAFIWANHS